MKNLTSEELYNLFCEDKEKALKIIYKIVKAHILYTSNSLPRHKVEDAVQDSIIDIFKIKKIENPRGFKFFCRKIAFRKALEHAGYKKYKDSNQTQDQISIQFQDKYIRYGSTTGLDFIDDYLPASEKHYCEKKPQALTKEKMLELLENKIKDTDDNCKFYLDLKLKALGKKIKLYQESENLGISYESLRQRISKCFKQLKKDILADKIFQELKN